MRDVSAKAFSAAKYVFLLGERPFVRISSISCMPFTQQSESAATEWWEAARCSRRQNQGGGAGGAA